MKSKHVVIVITMVLILLVVLVACSQAEQQQEPQDLNAQQTTPVTDVPTDVPTVEPTVEPAQTVEPVEADAQGEAGGAGEAGEVVTSAPTGSPEKEVLSGDALIAEFEAVYNYMVMNNMHLPDETEEEKIDFELRYLEIRVEGKGKELPADYIERYIDWRPIEEDSEEGSLVDTSTPTGTGTGTGTGGGIPSGSGGGNGISGAASNEGFTLEEKVAAWQDGTWREKGMTPPPPDLEDYLKNVGGDESAFVDGSQLIWNEFNYPDGVGFH